MLTIPVHHRGRAPPRAPSRSCRAPTRSPSRPTAATPSRTSTPTRRRRASAPGLPGHLPRHPRRRGRHLRPALRRLPPRRGALQRRRRRGLRRHRDGISILRFAEITGPTIIPNVSLDELGPIAPATPAPTRRARRRPMSIKPDVTPRRGRRRGRGTLPPLTSPDAAPDATPDAAPDVAADATPIGQVPARDISITRDGRYAIARVEGDEHPAPRRPRHPRDHRVHGRRRRHRPRHRPRRHLRPAVVRERSEVLRIPIPMGFSTPSAVTRTEATGEFVGSVTFARRSARAALHHRAPARTRHADGARRGAVAPGGAPAQGRPRGGLRPTAAPRSSSTAARPDRPTTRPPTSRPASTAPSATPCSTWGRASPSSSSRPPTLRPFAITTDGAYAFVLLRNDAASVAQAHRASMRSFAIDTLSSAARPTPSASSRAPSASSSARSTLRAASPSSTGPPAPSSRSLALPQRPHRGLTP